MALKHLIGILIHPTQEWQKIHDSEQSVAAIFFGHTALLALLPAVCWYIGTTAVGWSVGDQDAVKLTASSASIISVLFYLAMLVGVFVIGTLIHWMAQTYGAESTLAKGIALATHTATPLFIAGILGLYPILSLDLIVGFVALSFTVYLLFTGVPIMMDITKEQGVLFSCAILAVGMVGVVAMMVATVILWSMGAAPVFTD